MSSIHVNNSAVIPKGKAHIHSRIQPLSVVTLSAPCLFPAILITKKIKAA